MHRPSLRNCNVAPQNSRECTILSRRRGGPTPLYPETLWHANVLILFFLNTLCFLFSNLRTAMEERRLLIDSLPVAEDSYDTGSHYPLTMWKSLPKVCAHLRILVS